MSLFEVTKVKTSTSSKKKDGATVREKKTAAVMVDLDETGDKLTLVVSELDKISLGDIYELKLDKKQTKLNKEEEEEKD